MDCCIWFITEGILKQFVVEWSNVGVKKDLLILGLSFGQRFDSKNRHLTLLGLCVIVKVDVYVLVKKKDHFLLPPLLLLGLACANDSSAVGTKGKSYDSRNKRVPCYIIDLRKIKARSVIITVYESVWSLSCDFCQVNTFFALSSRCKSSLSREFINLLKLYFSNFWWDQ